jgi:hypothetical protein
MAQAPEWARDEKQLDDAKQYLRQGNTVDLFELVAAAALREQPINLKQFCLDLVVGMKQGKMPRAEGEFVPKQEKDQEYMRSTNMSEFLDAWILALLASKPRPQTDVERLEFHANYLASLLKP